MADESQVDQLLDEWEELRESNPRLSLHQFVKDRLAGADNELIEAFRHQAEELASIDRQIEQFAGPPPTAHQTPKSDGDHLRLSALKPGLKPIPGYKLLSRLGGGGFGEVWKAKSPGGFYVALKFVQIGGRVCEVEERSLEVIKDVRHPHLLSVFGTWRIGDLLIIATELADRTLLDRFHEAQKEGHDGIPKDELFVYLAEAAKGIDFLNDPGKSGRMRIQHRDIKPQNLLLSGGSVKVGDFGLARSIQSNVTGHTGSLTFAYAAPECFDGITSHRSDQYSLAITYCHLRGGRLPFDGTQVQIMEGHRKKQPDLSMVPAQERPAVAKALAKRPKDRWNSCSEFLMALSSLTTRNPGKPTQRPISTPSRTLPKRMVGSAVVILFGLTIVLLLHSSQNRSGEGRHVGFKSDPSQVEKVPGLEMKQKSLSSWDDAISGGVLERQVGKATSLELLLEDFPSPFVRYRVESSAASRFPDEVAKYSLIATIDSDQYLRFCQKLDGFLAPVASSSGEGTLGLASETAFGFKGGLLQYGITSPTSLANAIHRAVGYKLRQRVPPEGCVILVGQRLFQVPWGKQDEGSLRDFKGGNRILTVKWYWVSESAARPLMMAFREMREIQISLSIGGTPLPVIRPVRPLSGFSRHHEYITSPGGAVGRIFHTGIHCHPATLAVPASQPPPMTRKIERGFISHPI